MKECDFCYKKFEYLEEFEDGAEIFFLCEKCLESFKQEIRFNIGEDNYAP